jgi:hypothetical protein
MHSQLQKLVDANTRLEDAERALADAQEHRRQCARDLARIEDEAERTAAGVYAYQTFGKGLSIALAEAVTGLPGKRGQSDFLVLCKRKTYQPKGRQQSAGDVTYVHEPMAEWPKLDALEREVISTHIKHGKPYWLEKGLGWTNVSVSLSPDEARAFLQDPTAALAACHDLTREDFVAWLSSYGTVGCDGFYDNGKRCNSRVAGVRSQLRLDQWKAAWKAGGYCKRHGGNAAGTTSA